MSDFGRGFVYNLILFSKHWFRFLEDMDTFGKLPPYKKDWQSGRDRGAALSFNGAGDHMFDFVIPKQFENKPIGKLSKKIQDKVLACRFLGNEKDFNEVTENIAKLSRLIDNELGVRTKKAKFD